MSAALLNGKEVSAQIKADLQKKTSALLSKGLRAPGLAVILINGEPASATYVKNKRLTCKQIGFESFNYDLPEQTTEKELIALIESLNAAPHIDGILVQLPLPKHIDAEHIIEAIHPSKDVDGFHPYNLGRLAQKNPALRPCTPYGIVQLLQAYNLHPEKKHAVIVGASNIVGRPMALELLMAGSTITVCHSRTQNLAQHVEMADIVVVATGRREVVKVAWLQPHQIIIDVGIHRLADQSLCGDVDFEEARHRVAWITPVPGGVGPMTVIILMQNTLSAYQRSMSSQS